MLFYKEYISKTEEYVKQILKDDHTGHDWWHINRVRDMALKLAKDESVNILVIEMAALLHDIVDDKLVKNAKDEMVKVETWLTNLSIHYADVNHIMDIIKTISFKGGLNKQKMASIEGRIVQDADRLDAIGALGIARTFAFAGNRGNIIHDPGLLIRETMTFDEYRNGKSTAINHFYEKLLILTSQMNTSQAKIIALKRHAFMEQFLTQFFKEWNGQA
jgi:uncharacterized protein